MPDDESPDFTTEQIMEKIRRDYPEKYPDEIYMPDILKEGARPRNAGPDPTEGIVPIEVPGEDVGTLGQHLYPVDLPEQGAVAPEEAAAAAQVAPEEVAAAGVGQQIAPGQQVDQVAAAEAGQRAGVEQDAPQGPPTTTERLNGFVDYANSLSGPESPSFDPNMAPPAFRQCCSVFFCYDYIFNLVTGSISF